MPVEPGESGFAATARTMPDLPTLLHAPDLKPCWRWLLLCLMAVTCGFAFAPSAPQLTLDNGDKLQHMLAFACLAGCALLASDGDRRALWRVVAFSLGFGVFIEVVQIVLPTRSADWRDVMADMLGAGIGMLGIATLRRLVPAQQGDIKRT
jgi:VanZ family protein